EERLHVALRPAVRDGRNDVGDEVAVLDRRPDPKVDVERLRSQAAIGLRPAVRSGRVLRLDLVVALGPADRHLAARRRERAVYRHDLWRSGGRVRAGYLRIELTRVCRVRSVDDAVDRDRVPIAGRVLRAPGAKWWVRARVEQPWRSSNANCT